MRVVEAPADDIRRLVAQAQTRAERVLAGKLEEVLRLVGREGELSPQNAARVVAAANQVFDGLQGELRPAFLDGLEGAVDQALRDADGRLGDILGRMRVATLAELEPSHRAFFRDFVALFVQDLSEETRRKVVAELRMGASGSQPFTEVLDRLRHRIGLSQTRAERIARTEIMRAYSQSAHLRYSAADDRFPGTMRKRWLHAGFGQDSRSGHIFADSVYAADPIPVQEPFSVNGYSAQYPRDPSLPASESVSCRCRHIVVPA